MQTTVEPTVASDDPLKLCSRIDAQASQSLIVLAAEELPCVFYAYCIDHGHLARSKVARPEHVETPARAAFRKRWLQTEEGLTRKKRAHHFDKGGIAQHDPWPRAQKAIRELACGDGRLRKLQVETSEMIKQTIDGGSVGANIAVGTPDAFIL